MRSGSGQHPPRGRFSGNRPSPQQQRTPQRNQTFDSNGPNVKVRGSATQIFERYVALAREAAIGDDRIAAENLYQHAEHYFRIANAARDGNQQGLAPPATSADIEASGEPEHGSDETGELSPNGWGDDRPGFA
jgi:hypothetical protein